MALAASMRGDMVMGDGGGRQEREARGKEPWCARVWETWAMVSKKGLFW